MRILTFVWIYCITNLSLSNRTLSLTSLQLACIYSEAFDSMQEVSIKIKINCEGPHHRENLMAPYKSTYITIEFLKTDRCDIIFYVNTLNLWWSILRDTLWVVSNSEQSQDVVIVVVWEGHASLASVSTPPLITAFNSAVIRLHWSQVTERSWIIMNDRVFPWSCTAKYSAKLCITAS